MGESAREGELAIRNLIERYADAVNRRDADEWASLWSEDGVWDAFGNRISGREAVVAAWQAAMRHFAFVFHVAHSAVIDVDGDTARGRWTVSERLRDTRGTPGLLLALYHDEYHRRDGAWRRSLRRLEPLYHGPPDGSGDLPGAREE
jgi:uncharacterized protein (TIGR02246 family)